MICDFEKGQALGWSTANRKAKLELFGKLPPNHVRSGLTLNKLKKFMKASGEPIGDKKLNGKKVRGFRIASGSGRGVEVWADAETGVPVRIKTRQIMITDIALNKPLDDSLFRLKAPEGYEVQVIDKRLLPSTQAVK